MSEFKNQAEVWQALLDGKTICNTYKKFKITDRTVFSSTINDNDWEECSLSFVDYDQFHIYTEPKQKKIVRMAPALILADGDYFVGGNLFSSEKSAINYHARGSLKFIKWLIDTPYAVDVEVDDE